jgi:GDP-4-dehydro-6-deoxy-D-mannose reductase
MKILITGIAGQTGSHLADYILETFPKYEVHGIVRYRTDLTNIAQIKDKLKLHNCDLRDAHNVDRVISEVKPDKVFHLAATSFVRDSFLQPSEVIDNNTRSQINLFESLLKHCPCTIIQVACSSEQFGLVRQGEIPIKEDNPMRPLSPYGVSKCAQEFLAIQYYHSYKLSTVITRTFNHTGPRRTEAFVESTFCEQIAAYENKLPDRTNIILHGNLDSIRDYTDARDVARAYWLATEHCAYGEPYNICSNNKITIGGLLDMLTAMSPHTFERRPDPKRMRPSDVTLLHGDCSKFIAATDWKPEHTLEGTMGDLLYAWRKKYRVA